MRPVVVGMGECRASSDPGVTLISSALGSCVGLAAYDPQARTGALLHYQLPCSRLDPARAACQPALFADTGLELLLGETSRMGARPERLVLIAAGGARMADPGGYFNVGKRNWGALCDLLLARGFRLAAAEVGGRIARALRIDVATGAVWLRGEAEKHWHPVHAAERVGP